MTAPDSVPLHALAEYNLAAASRIERAIELYLSTAEGAAMLRPEPLPDARDLDIAGCELPPLYEAPAEAVARIGDLYREQVPVGD
ncbi:hypothetical protein [Streptomyces sp. NPDC051576]|uniref:hypothetical protein n=1 Tax=Streptomyces sp. NPDC051576 TaxID=3155803 RepID=UPI00342DBA72